MFQFLRQLWHRLCARLRFCGGVQYLAGTASLPSPLSPAEEKALLARMAAGEADARDALILHNLRLVVYLAKKYENSGVPAEDLISIGTIGLIKAVNTFTPERSIMNLISGIPELFQVHTGLLHGFCHKSELPVFV